MENSIVGEKNPLNGLIKAHQGNTNMGIQFFYQTFVEQILKEALFFPIQYRHKIGLYQLRIDIKFFDKVDSSHKCNIALIIDGRCKNFIWR